MSLNETIKKMQTEIDRLKQEQYEKLCAEYVAHVEALTTTSKKLKELGFQDPAIECTTCGDVSYVNMVCNLCE